MAAVALMLCLGLGLAGVLVLGRDEDAVKAVKEVAQDTDCQFTAASERLIVTRLRSRHSQQKFAVLGGENYPILKQNNGYYLLHLRQFGWANSQDGTSGGDCEDIPIDATPLADFPTMCVFTNPQEVVLYRKPDGVNAIGTVSPGSYVIESTTGNQYYIGLGENGGGWVAVADGQIAGDCDSLPVAPG